MPLQFRETGKPEFGQDFMSRADGYAGFAKAYNFNLQTAARMDLSLTYRALIRARSISSPGIRPHGLIAALDLFQLEDDKRYFRPIKPFLSRDATSLKS